MLVNNESINYLTFQLSKYNKYPTTKIVEYVKKYFSNIDIPISNQMIYEIEYQVYTLGKDIEYVLRFYSDIVKRIQIIKNNFDVLDSIEENEI